MSVSSRKLQNLCGNTVALWQGMRAFPAVVLAISLMPVAAFGQQRVPPEADRSGGGQSAPAPAAPRESAPPPAAAPAPPPPPAPAPPPPPPAQSSEPTGQTAVPRTAAPRSTTPSSNPGPSRAD